MRKVTFTLLSLMCILFSSCEENSRSEKKTDDIAIRDIAPENIPLASPTLEELPTINFENKIVDFGEVVKGEVLDAVYTFTNEGNSTLIIEYVNPDCTCTSHSVSNKEILPGEQGEVRLQLDTKDKYGKQKIFAVVKANTKTKFYRLLLKASILE